LSPALEDFVKAYGESVHDQWSYAKVNRLNYYFVIILFYIQIEQGWVHGDQINDKYRQHPNLKAYKSLDRKVHTLFVLFISNSLI
jgi:hypothetical protein